MTKELLQQALDALEYALDDVQTNYAVAVENYGGIPTREKQLACIKECLDNHNKAIEALKAALAQPVQPDWLLSSTQDLAKHIARRCYPEVPQFEVLSDLAGVISQIDNMITGMERKVKPVQSANQIHSCSYFCNLPACTKAQRDEFRDRFIASQPLQPAVVCIAIGMGAIYDFAGFLTTRETVVTASAHDDAAPMAEAVKAFAKKRNLDGMVEPNIKTWHVTLAQPVQPAEPNIPSGYQLVLIEPTIAMLENGSIASDYDLSQNRVKAVYRAVLNAATPALAQPVQPAEDNMEIVGYQYQWTNPADDPDPHHLPIEWETVIPAIGQTEQERLDELIDHRYSGKPVYRARALYTPKETK